MAIKIKYLIITFMIVLITLIGLLFAFKKEELSPGYFLINNDATYIVGSNEVTTSLEQNNYHKITFYYDGKKYQENYTLADNIAPNTYLINFPTSINNMDQIQIYLETISLFNYIFK